jgi:hypothetical protein
MSTNNTASRQYPLLHGDAPVHFDGKTYDAELDLARLTTLQDRVRGLMADGQWWSLQMLQHALRLTYGHRYSETSISARVRDLRKHKHGGRIVEAKRVTGGLWHYRMHREVVR